MSAARGGKKAKHGIQSFIHRHDREVLHVLVFFVVGSLFLGSYTLVGVAAASHSFEKLRTRMGNTPLFVEAISADALIETLPALLPRRLDGVLVAREDANRVPACVMIENAAFGGVRPQAGLSKASVVYEVIVEGGITRLMAVFDGEVAETIGPVRSARDTYLEFASELNCPYVHAGGSFTALQALDNFGMRDLDGLIESGYFWRDQAKFAPHDLFTSSENLRQAISDHGWAAETPPDFVPWNFVDDKGIADSGTPAQRVFIGFGGSYDVEYRYVSEQQAYERYNGGVLQVDANTSEPLLVKNVVIERVGDGSTVEGKGRINWPVTGEGDVSVIRLGSSAAGIWKKPARQERTQFFNEQGETIELARGNSWVEVVPPHISVTIE